MKTEDEKLAAFVADKERLERAAKQIRIERETAVPAVLSSGGSDGAEMRALASYMAGLNGRYLAVQHQIEQCSNRIRDQQTRCIEARREHRLIEKLREKRLREWEQELDKEQETLSDDVFLSKYAREKRF